MDGRWRDFPFLGVNAMSMPHRLRVLEGRRCRLRLWREPAAEGPATMWRINGYRASLLVWTAEEWAKLDDRPADAQYHPSGIWCALRID